MRKTVTQLWRLRLIFSRDHTEEIELPAAMSPRAVWRHVGQMYRPSRPAIHILSRGRKQLKVAKC